MYYPFLYKSYFEGDETHLSLSVKSVNPKSASLNLDGYKHSMVQIIALALAAKTAVIIENPPLVIDTYVFVALIKEMGGDAKIIHNKLHIDMKNVCINTISYYLSQLIHGSMYLCPALLCSNGEFNYYGSGGCRIGNGSNNERPVEHIMSVMKSFGACFICTMAVMQLCPIFGVCTYCLNGDRLNLIENNNRGENSMVCKNKLLLINPWQTYPKKLASEYQSYVPYGIACIASVGIMQGFDVKIIDCLVDDTETDLGEFVRYGKNENDLRNEIISFAPDIVGISCIFSMFEKDATDIASLVKSIDSRIIVILGGVTATLPEIYEPLLGRTDAYDLMVRGEGEEIFAEILKRYCKEQKTITDKSKIKGIAYKTTDGIVSTDSHPFIRSLDSLPFPALELLDIDKMLGNKYYSRWRNNPANKRSFPIFTSRGCPYNCCFCSVHSQVGYQHRMYSIDYVLELMKKCIVRFGINHFHFEDDNLTLDVNRAKRLFKEMASLNISWDTPNGVRADKIDEEMIQLMIASGLSSLSIAAESGNETVRTNIINKRLTTDSIINAVRLCDKYDLPCIVFFVLGFPGETFENIRETIQFAKNISELYGTINMIFIANPLPGTELSRAAKNKGYIKKDLENADYFVAIRANQAPIIATEEFDKKSIFFLLKEELDLPDYSVHNITQPMFWYNSQKANLRAYRAFPKMSNRKVDWKWVDEQ